MQFIKYARKLAGRVNHKLEAERSSAIGTKRLIAQIFSAYDAQDLLTISPPQSDVTVNAWLAEATS